MENSKTSYKEQLKTYIEDVLNGKISNGFVKGVFNGTYNPGAINELPEDLCKSMLAAHKRLEETDSAVYNKDGTSKF